MRFGLADFSAVRQVRQGATCVHPFETSTELEGLPLRVPKVSAEWRSIVVTLVVRSIAWGW